MRHRTADMGGRHRRRSSIYAVAIGGGRMAKVKTYTDAFVAETKRRSPDGLFAPQHDKVYGSRKPGQRAVFNFARRRINEIEKLIEHRHGVIPATDDADIYVWIVAQHIPELNFANLHEELGRWCARWAPEVLADEVAVIAAKALRKSYWFTADDLAMKLRVTDRERTALHITTIGAIDRPKAQRDMDHKKKKRVRDKVNAYRKRRQAGALSRADYEAKSLTKTKPWEAEGKSRRTWERDRKREAEPPPEECQGDGLEKMAA